MANMRAIRARIRSVKNTEQISKAMKMVSVSKLRKSQATMEGLRSFAEKSHAVIDTLLSGSEVPGNPFTQPRKEVRKVCYVLFVGNRGLCGSYNISLLHHLQQLLRQEKREHFVVVVGRWGRDVMNKMHIPVHETFTDLGDPPSEQEALELSEHLKSLYLSGEADEVHLVYQHFVNTLRQEPHHEQLLPAVNLSSAQENAGAGLSFIFVPDEESVLESALLLYINNTVFSTMVEARCGEHAARMTAMTTATDSTKVLIDSLQLSLNRARQAAITTEISEIVGGAAALKRKKS